MNTARRNRILFLEAGAGRGGSSISLCYLLKYLDREMVTPVVAFYFRNFGPDLERFRRLGVPVRFVTDHAQPTQAVRVRFLTSASRSRWVHLIKTAMRFVLHSFFVEFPQLVRLLKLMRAERIDVLVFNNDVQFHFVGALAGKLTRTPSICRKAGGIGGGGRLARYLTPWIDVFVAISRATEADQRLRRPRTRRLVRIAEGVDLAELTPGPRDAAGRARFGIPDDHHVVGSVARLQPGKGQRELIEAAVLVLREVPNATFLIAGDDDRIDGSFIRELRARVAALGIERHVVFTGWIRDVRQVLGILDVFVHCPTTWIEGLGIANLEAMAMGKPTIVSDNGGLTDAVLDGETGFVVPMGDIQALANRIVLLLRDPLLAASLGHHARAKVEQEFSALETTRRFEALLCEYAPGR